MIPPRHRPPRNGPAPPNPLSTARNLIPGTGSPGNRSPPRGVHNFRIWGTKFGCLPLKFGLGICCILGLNRILWWQCVGGSPEKGIVPLVEKVSSIQLVSGYSADTSGPSGRMNSRRRRRRRGSVCSGRSEISSSGSGFEGRDRHFSARKSENETLDLQKGEGSKYDLLGNGDKTQCPMSARCRAQSLLSNFSIFQRAFNPGQPDPKNYG